MTVDEELYECFKTEFERINPKEEGWKTVWKCIGLKVVMKFGDRMLRRYNKERKPKEKEISLDNLIDAIEAANSPLIFEQVAVVEQEDTLDSKSSAERHTGSTPVSDTTQKGEQDI